MASKLLVRGKKLPNTFLLVDLLVHLAHLFRKVFPGKDLWHLVFWCGAESQLNVAFSVLPPGLNVQSWVRFPASLSDATNLKQEFCMEKIMWSSDRKLHSAPETSHGQVYRGSEAER